MNGSNIVTGQMREVELRQVWKTEDGDFTPWLAKPENLQILSTAIGIDLQIEELEKQVGSYRADIVCKDNDSGQLVIIENQIEPTDHSHIGQLLTYSVGLNAMTSVWISSKFSDPHRATLDRLNEITPEGFRFFGVEVELWRIGDSDAALKLRVVSGPNGRPREDGPLSDSSPIVGLRREYWAVCPKGTGLGSVEKLSIRDLWPSGDADFTSWLADNLQHLSGALCVEFELADSIPSNECSSYVLARKIQNDKVHVTRDDELVPVLYLDDGAGQAPSSKLLSLGEKFNAYAAVWISEEFGDKQKEAIESLNRRPAASTEFYGVEFEAIRINDSPPALRFDVVVAPDEWYTREKPPNAREQSMNSEFIERLSTKLEEYSFPERIGRRNYRSPYRIIEYPVPRVRYAAIWHRGEPGFEVVIAGTKLEWNWQIFRGLEQEKVEIEGELKKTEEECFCWQPPESENRDHSEDGGRKVNEAKVIVYRRGNVHVNKDSWNDIQEWMISKIPLFREVFTHRLEKLTEEFPVV